MIRIVSVLMLSGLAGCGTSSPDPSPDVPDAAAADVADAAQSDAPLQVSALDPDSLLFFDLPIGSIRYAVSGYEPSTDSCVALIWYLSSIGDPEPLCGLDTDGFNPYAVVADPTPPSDPAQGPIYGARPCEVWDYGPNATITALTGCATFGAEPGTGTVDLVVALEHERFTGDLTVVGQSP